MDNNDILRQLTILDLSDDAMIDHLERRRKRFQSRN
jgi:hypothetical protein